MGDDEGFQRVVQIGETRIVKALSRGASGCMQGFLRQVIAGEERNEKPDIWPQLWPSHSLSCCCSEGGGEAKPKVSFRLNMTVSILLPLFQKAANECESDSVLVCVVSQSNKIRFRSLASTRKTALARQFNYHCCCKVFLSKKRLGSGSFPVGCRFIKVPKVDQLFPSKLVGAAPDVAYL